MKQKRTSYKALNTLIAGAQDAGSVDILAGAIRKVLQKHQEENERLREEIERLRLAVDLARDEKRKMRSVVKGLTKDTQENILTCARFVISHLRDKQRWADNERSAISAATSLIQSDGPVVTFVVDPGG